MTRTVADLLAALKPKGYVDAWVYITRTEGGSAVAHRVRLHKTDLIDDLKKLTADMPARFQIREWTYANVNRNPPGVRWRARWITIGTDDPDEIEPLHELEYRSPARDEGE